MLCLIMISHSVLLLWTKANLILFCSVFFLPIIQHRFLIGLQPLIWVIFGHYGGADLAWHNSVEMLQANNIMINTTTDESCEFLRQTVLEWVAAVSVVETRKGVSLHLLHLTFEPIRCGLDPLQVCYKICEPKQLFNCDEVCKGWEGTFASQDNRIKWYEDKFDIRPNDVAIVSSVPVQWNYSLPNGTVVQDEFFVEAQFNESGAVTQT